MNKKRKISKKVTGIANGKSWYMLVFAACLVGTTLYERKTVWVEEDIYNAVEEGQELDVVE